MPQNAAAGTFACPNCGAPVEPIRDAKSAQCGYCGATVIIPEALRTYTPSATPQFDFGAVNMNAMFTQATQMPRVYTLAQQGKFEEAAEIYSQLTGLSQEAAIRAVKGMVGRR
ncbi:MAG TPA: hypothetical protein VMT73_10940 [Anaerolineales bacterium]|nr:hypothetical protein [Anaerolineales bacterium]